MTAGKGGPTGGQKFQRPLRLSDKERPHIFVEVTEPRGPLRKMRGLIGSSGLGPGQGMLLRTRQVHTFGMAFAIDALYLSRDGRVLKVRTLRPNRMGPLVLSAYWVLETEAGEAARLDIREGTHLSRGEP